MLKKIIINLALFASSFASAQVTQKLQVTTKVNPSAEPGQLEVNAVFDTVGLGPTLANDPKNAAYPLYLKIVENLASLGTVTKGLETGPARTSVRVIVGDDVQKVPVLENERPLVISQLLKIDELIAPLSEDMQKLPLGFSEKYGNGPYLNLQFGSKKELTRFYMCVGLEYQGTVAKAIHIPNAVKTLIANECQETYSDLSFLEQATALEVNSVLSGEQAPDFDWHEHPDYWRLVDSLALFNMCGDLGNNGFAISAGWTDASGAFLDQLRKCHKFLYRNVVEQTRNILVNGLNTSVLKAPINSYYRSFVQQLLNKTAAPSQVTIGELQKKVNEVIGKTLMVGNGFTKNELKSSEFNTQDFVQALQEPVEDPNSLLLILLSSPSEELSPLRKELAASEDKDSYVNLIKANLAQYCNAELFSPSCIYNGAVKISQSQIQLTLRSGLQEEVKWQGYYLVDPRKGLAK